MDGVLAQQIRDPLVRPGELNRLGGHPWQRLTGTVEVAGTLGDQRLPLFDAGDRRTQEGRDGPVRVGIRPRGPELDAGPSIALQQGAHRSGPIVTSPTRRVRRVGLVLEALYELMLGAPNTVMAGRWAKMPAMADRMRGFSAPPSGANAGSPSRHNDK